MRGSILAVLMLAAACPAAAKGAPEPALRDLRFKLIGSVVTERGLATREIEPGGSIPNLPGESCYSWSLAFAPTEGDLRIEEQLQLPAPAPNWHSEGRTTVAPDRQSGRTVLMVDGAGGQAANGWCVAEGDPEGRYRFVISSAGKVVAQVTFFVGEFF